jgi:anti-sigma factor RsiW
MNCEQAQEMLPELLTGALSPKAEQETLAHLACCEACRRELAFWAKAAEAVRAGAEEMPNELFKGIRQNLAEDRPLTLLETLQVTRRALGLAGSACRLAFSVAGLNQ